MPPLTFTEPKITLKTYSHKPGTVELYVQLKITDNEAQTLENALHQHGFDVKLRKWTHYEIEHAHGLDQKALADELIASGELLNLNKESVAVVLDGQSFPKNPAAHYFLVCDFEDSSGASKTAKLRHKIKQGCFWEVSGKADLEKLLATNIFANPHANTLESLIKRCNNHLRLFLRKASEEYP